MAKVNGDRTAPRDIHRVPELCDFYVYNGSKTDISEFGPSLARQEFAEECDINVIMARYEATGVITHYTEREPMYVNLIGAPDLMGAMDMIANAEKAFMMLPAKVRREFDNDAVKFVDFASDSANLEKMREWGLAPPAKQEPGPSPAAPAGPAGGAAPPAPPTAPKGAVEAPAAP